MITQELEEIAYEDALVQVIRVFAARGRAIREEHNKEHGKREGLFELNETEINAGTLTPSSLGTLPQNDNALMNP